MIDIPSDFLAVYGDIAESLQEFEEEAVQHLATIQSVVGLEIRPHLRLHQSFIES